MSSKIPVVFVSNPSQKTKYYCTDCKFSSFDIGELLKHKSFKDHKSIASTKIVRSDFISVFDCNLCNKNFKCSSDLKRHNNERHINKSCSICKKEVRASWLSRHIRQTHIPATFECNQCTRKFKTSKQLNVHVNANHTKKDFICTVCGQQFGLEERLKIHFKSVHEGIKYYCDQCDYQSKTKQGMKVHSKYKHSLGAKFVCSFCELEFSERIQLDAHREEAHSNLMDPKKIKPRKKKDHICKICGEKFNCKQSKLVHKWKVHDGIRQKCEYDNCDYRTYQKTVLNDHINTIHLKTIEKCSLCDFKTTTKSYVKNHMRRKHADKFDIYACDKCNYRCTSKALLQRHFKFKERKHD